MKTVGILNGPNLHRLGRREPGVYGSESLDTILARVRALAEENNLSIEHFQSNHEGDLIEKVHVWSDAGVSLGIVNPAGLTHTSVALRDAIADSATRFVEVHLSHIHAREPFRHTSFTAPVCLAQVSGMGAFGYLAALRFLIQLDT